MEIEEVVTTTKRPPILKNHVRILRVNEYEILREKAKTLQNRTRLDTLLLTGLRYVEAQRLHDHPDWFDGNFLNLPDYAVKKAKRKQKERSVRLNPRGLSVLPYFFKGKNLPSWKSWTEDLKRWALRANIDPTGLSPKTTRKTWESWLVCTYSEKHPYDVFLSQGHTEATSMRHYMNLPFTPEDRLAMQRWVTGWI